MELILIEPDSPEWNYMWNWLEKHPLNEGIEDPSIALNEGQTWQYMGSYKQDTRVLHTFRHRIHPTTKEIQNLTLEASKDLTDEQIVKKFKL